MGGPLAAVGIGLRNNKVATNSVNRNSKLITLYGTDKRLQEGAAIGIVNIDHTSVGVVSASTYQNFRSYFCN